MSSGVKEVLELRLSDADIAAIRIRVQRRKAAIAAAVAVRETGVVELDLSDDSDLAQAYKEAVLTNSNHTTG